MNDRKDHISSLVIKLTSQMAKDEVAQKQKQRYLQNKRYYESQERLAAVSPNLIPINRSQSQLNTVRVSEASIVTVELKNHNKGLQGHQAPKQIDGSFVDDGDDVENKRDDSDEIQESPQENRSYQTSRLEGMNRLSANASQVDLKSRTSRRMPKVKNYLSATRNHNQIDAQRRLETGINSVA